MTSINAIKFDNFSGATACDEQRGWNEENLKILCTDKIKPVVPLQIQQTYGVVAAYGNTGTSSIGDELRFRIKQKIQQRYDEEVQKLGKQPAQFMTISEIAALTFQIICDLKHTHTDEYLASKYGFKTPEYCQGFYQKDGRRIEIKDKEILETAYEAISWQKRSELATSVFLNCGIIAGYDPQEGFRIFHLSMIYGFYEPVAKLFLAEGSGLDFANVKLADYISTRSLPERRGQIEPVDGLISIIEAVNAASHYNIGVGGYVNLILFNGRAQDHRRRMTEINDDRAKLASEIVHAYTTECLTRSQAGELLDQLLLQEQEFEVVNADMWSKSSNPRRLFRILRGYKPDF